MRVKSLALGTLAAAGLFALTATTASAQVVYTSPPVVTQTYIVPAPVYYAQPTYVVPSYGYYARPAVSFGYSSGYSRPYYGGGYGGHGGYRGGYGGSYYGGRPGFSFGINIR